MEIAVEPAVTRDGRRRIALAAMVAGLCSAVFAVAPVLGQGSQLRFEIADVHRSAATARNRGTEGAVFHAGRIEIRRATTIDLITIAWGVDADMIRGGAPWLDTDRFDVIARYPVDTPHSTVKLMLRALLADRFGLAVYGESRTVSGYVLTAGNGAAKLKAAEGSGEGGCSTRLQRGNGPAPEWQARCRNLTMAGLAEALHGLDSRYLTGHVADRTGVTGSWDFDFHWTDKRSLSYAGADGVTLFQALDQQLGLRLSPGAIPVAALAVDRAHPLTPNSADVNALLPPPLAPRFEVASLRQSAPGEPPGRRLIAPGGRVEMRGIPLFALILQAWDLNIDPDEGLPGAPKWLRPFEPSFDLIAKAPAASVSDGGAIDEDEFGVMLRALLMERFRMAVHYEDRPVDAYTLVGAKPKLKRADSAGRAGCRTESMPVNGQTRVTATCRNMTMARFAEQLQMIAPNYVRYPVLNASGIEGGWDFTFTFSSVPPRMLASSGGQGGPRGGAGAADRPLAAPVGGVSLFSAVEKQVGLKLEKHKRAGAVFVVDHMDERAVDN